MEVMTELTQIYWKVRLNTWLSLFNEYGLPQIGLCPVYLVTDKAETH